MKKRMLKSTAIILSAVMLTGISGCGKEKKESIDLDSKTVDELVTGAKEEGRVDSVGMPDNWANWGATWNDLNEKYGLEHSDIDISSAEEIAMFEAEKDSPTKDIGDVGQSMGRVAVEKGVTQPYKTSYWDEIPDWAKDEEGHWIIGYLGTLGWITNTDKVPNAPTTWEDIKNGDYKVAIGDVVKATQSQAAIIATAFAYGGDLENLQPGFDYWKGLAEAGRIDKGNCDISRMETGEIDVAILWDYNALIDRDQLQESHPTTTFQCNIPADGSVQVGYCTIINKYAPHPYSAALAREYILSDEGQINLAEGYATPIREVELPEELQVRRIATDQYANAVPISDFDAWDKATAAVSEFWSEEIIPILQ